MVRPLAFASLLLAGCSSDPSQSPPAQQNPDGAPDSVAADAPDADPCGPLGSAFTRCSHNPVHVAGGQHADGRYEIVIADPSFLFDTDDGKWKAWWQSPLGKTFSDPESTTTILYAESADGLQWSVQEAPVLSAKGSPQDWDYDRVETPSVVKVPGNPPDRRYVMYYAGGNFQAVQTPFGSQFVWYQLGVAFSADGKSFKRLPASESPYASETTPYQAIDGLLLLGRDAFPAMANAADALVADPEVVIVNGVWHLYFSSMPVDAAYSPLSFGISHATSSDGIHWTMDAANPVLVGGQQPSVLWNASSSRFEMFYNGDSDAEKAAAPSTFNPSVNVSLATSTDGASFVASQPEHVLSWDPSHQYEVYGWLTGADVVLRPDGYWLFYTGWSNKNVPKDFYLPVRNDSCTDAGATCLCFDAGGQASCVVPSVVTLDLARRAL